jgi:diguanylate cyclase (GGDEF)-like protein
MSGRSIIYNGSWPGKWSDLLSRFCDRHGLQLETTDDFEEVHASVNRSYPSCLVLEGTRDTEAALALCAELKKDPFTAVVPIVVLVLADQAGLISDWLASGADEVVSESQTEREQDLRLELVVRRAQRDVAVHPTTRLPGTVQIERNIGDRLITGEEFAVCYADLDNFKEFNDRYGYNHGDHVILLLSRILRDVVRGLAVEGFVGHIGGDDFIFLVNMKYLESCCDEVIYLFDELIPYQYTMEDRRAGYFLGKDRRGSIRRVPLMTLSIGVVTNQIQPFTHTAQVSELAAEMKTYTKSLPGSVYAVDRRRPLKEEVEQP